MYKRSRVGSAHLVIVAFVVLAIVGALGVVFYRNFIAKKDTASSTQTTTQADAPKQKENTITEISGSDMMRYTNNTLGFQFDFPKQTYGSSGCHATNQWYDSNGVLVTAPVTSYSVDSGTVDMTVLQSEDTFTIVQKQAPQFTVATYGSDSRQYNSGCKMVDVTEDLLAQGNVMTEARSWQVYKLSSTDEIAATASKLKFFPNQDNVASVSYSLGTLENGRQEVTYSFTYKDPDALTGGQARKTWYYPKQKLLVNIGLGTEVSFAKPSDHESFYIDQIVSSFSVL